MRRSSGSDHSILIAVLVFVGTASLSIAVYGFANGHLDLRPWMIFAEALGDRLGVSLDAFENDVKKQIAEAKLEAEQPGEAKPHAESSMLRQSLIESLLPHDDDSQIHPPGVDDMEAKPIVVGPPTPYPTFDRSRVLSDYQERISKDFHVEPGMRERTAFWFDVYTRWDSNDRIIHDSRHPWIIYKVVNVASILESNNPPHRWLRNMKADQMVRMTTLRVRNALTKLARKRTLQALTPEEREIVEPLRNLPGNLASLAKAARNQVRVQTGQRDFFVSGLLVSPRYLTAMEKIFSEKKLPWELTRLPFVESSFNKAATSKVGASGIWQLMGETGGKFLIVDNHIDERRSPYKATEAAAKLLKENHLILYRSWPLAVTAWNHGPGGVRKAVQNAHSRDLALILERYHTKHFDFASSNFYAEFIAALHAETYKDQIFGPLTPEPEQQTLFIALPKAYHLAELLKLSGLDREELIHLNPDLEKAILRNSALPRGYRLHVPSDRRQAIESALRAGIAGLPGVQKSKPI